MIGYIFTIIVAVAIVLLGRGQQIEPVTLVVGGVLALFVTLDYIYTRWERRQ